MPASKRLVGKVVSDAMDKTVVIEVIRLSEHPLYSKKVKKRRKFKAHDEANACKPGDKVLIEETRPLSKTKRWRVVTILEQGVEEGGEEIDSTDYNA